MKRNIIILHLLLLLYSISGIFSKLAALFGGVRLEFFLCYGVVLLILFVYAIGWQQIIKKIPLTTAFANKAITTVWGMVWGILFFHEKVTKWNVLGVVLIIVGIVFFVRSGSENGN